MACAELYVAMTKKKKVANKRWGGAELFWAAAKMNKVASLSVTAISCHTIFLSHFPCL